MDINLNHLETFCILAETLSFSRTAKLLSTSQPSVSRTIKNLEKDLGHELFLRASKQVQLTKEGMALMDKVMPSYKELVSAISNNKIVKTKIRAGSIPEAGRHFFAPIFGEVCHRLGHNFQLVLKSPMMY